MGGFTSKLGGRGKGKSLQFGDALAVDSRRNTNDGGGKPKKKN